ncbi:TPA: sigma factor [Bacillus cereus]|uniref:sigma factor n=1 Tax=unclassified Bacillus (in: firmicutes) TaxID=185979 RepID=UPI0009F80D0B|nr:sigma factor [Bacillus sp. N35-10-4]
MGKVRSNLESIKSNIGLEIEDLIQCGMIGLLEARENFDSAYGCKFSTLAIINNQKVKVTREIFYLKGRVIRGELAEEKLEFISQLLGVSVENVEEALRYQQIPSSLHDVTFSSENDLTLEQMLVDESSIGKTEEIDEKIVMCSFINTLPDRELMIWDM